MRPDVNIDQIVDYRAEYSSYIKKHTITGDQLIGLCPFHEDKNDSFSANLKTGKWKCFAEDRGGNFISFWAEINGVDNATAYKQILRKYGVQREPEEKKTRGPNLGSYTLEEYAFQKRLPLDFLRDVCGAGTGKDKDKTSFLKLPYFNEDGSEPVFRKRYAHKQFRWSKGSSGRLILYGDWRLPEIRKAGWAILVEGESDTQTLWHLTFPALGVPGASNFKQHMAEKLQNLRLYIHVEPDKGGETFLQKVTKGLREAEFSGAVYAFSCKGFGVKDPSQLFLEKAGEGGEERVKAMINKALREAKKLDLDSLGDTIPEAVRGAPVNLRQPQGWKYSENGIQKFDEKTYVPVTVCRTPIILTRRIRSVDTGEEKIEIAFKRDGAWQQAIFPRSTIFTARNITVLADLGCTITSENAKQVVSFLAALEAENIDIIKKADSTSTMGWQIKKRFLPGHGGDIIMDIEPSLRTWADAYHRSGTFETWRRLMEPHRERDKFRFILAASFTAPLLRIIRQRNFFVYNWGGSKGGKTAALKAALSAWGDPERLMANFNATKVAMERIAGFFNDLPMGIDERQMAGKQQDLLDTMVYMLAGGTGRARGNKTGGLQTLKTWRTVAMATGEEPLSKTTTQTGVSTRVIEIYGRPFLDEQSASLMHQQTAQHYGWAGPEFIRRLLCIDEQSIRDQYKRMTEAVYQLANGASGAHVSAVSAVALADTMVEDWLFRPQKNTDIGETSGNMPLTISPASWERALRMAALILKENTENGIGDVNEHATQFIVDWILSNQSQFGDRALGTCLGFMGDRGEKAYIFPTLLNQALEKAGFDQRKTLAYLAEQGIITRTKRNGRGFNSVVKWFNNRSCRFIEFDIGKFARQADPLSEDEAAASIGKLNKDESGFMKLPEDSKTPFDGIQEELPF